MKLNWTKTMVGVFAIVLLVVAVAFAQTVRRAHMHGDGMFGGHALHFMARYLDLTDAQQAQAKDILAKERPAMQPLMQQLAQSRHAERTMIESGTFDETQARTLATQRSQIMTELAFQKMRVESELYQVLTAEQKTKLKTFLDEREQRFGKHMLKPTEEQ